MSATHKWELGCYGDGVFGHQHTREVCASMVAAVVENTPDLTRHPRYSGETLETLVKDLRGEMSDDGGEEYDACDWLNEHASVEGASWDWRDGDFGLWPNEEE